MNWLLSSRSLSNKGVAFVRVVVGVLLIIHGTQAFNSSEMTQYGQWLDALGVALPLAMAYIGKGIELVGGLCLVAGLYVRVACICLMGTFLFISVVMGGGKILTDAQHSFLFFLFSALFFFCGDSGYPLRRFFS
ncbi:MAG TPA: DoxX family protein [Chryseosolibacter sp.]